jgi:hypothetical protein
MRRELSRAPGPQTGTLYFQRLQPSTDEPAVKAQAGQRRAVSAAVLNYDTGLKFSLPAFPQ